MADYIPGGDAAFNAWLDNFVTYATANLAGLGLVAGDLTPITTAQTAWATSLSDHSLTWEQRPTYACGYAATRR